MQADNYNYKPDEQFTNQGWEAMHKKLDKEMPVERKKRRGVIWFYFLGAMLLAGGIWFLNYKKHQTTIPETEQNVYANSDYDKKQEVSQSQSQSQSQKNIKDEKSLTIDNIKSEDLNLRKEALVNHSGTINKSTDQLINNTTISSNGLSNMIDDNSTITSDITNNLTINETGLISEEVVSEIVELNNSNSGRASLTMSSISFLNFYLEENVRQNPEIDENAFEGNLAEVVKYKAPQKRKIKIGLNAGVLLDMENNQKLGSSVATQIHFPIGKKLGIRTGLGYSRINKDLLYQFSGEQLAEYIDPTTIVTVPPSSPSLNIANIAVNTATLFSLDRFHYLETPLLFTYSPNTKWQFLLGANASFLIKDELTSIESNYSFSNDNDAANLGIELESVREESVDLEQFRKQDFWNKWNMNAVFGVEFNLNSNWNVGLQYHRSFSRFLETNEEGVFADEISLGPTVNSNGFNSAYSVQNDFRALSLSADNSFSKIRDINTNHSIRLVLGYSF